MNRIYYFLFLLLFVVPTPLFAQSIKFSDFDKEDTKDINFSVIGKLRNKVLVYKNIRSNHKISIYDNEMNTLGTVKLGFVPEKTFNIDFVVYADFFYMIYQYQKGTILHCMVVKMDDQCKKMTEPVEVDTTRIPVMTDNKIYSTISSEDKQKIMIFKIQARSQKFSIATLLFDNQMKLINKNRQVVDYDERSEVYDNFSLGNDGNFIFTHAVQSGNSYNSNRLGLIIHDQLQNSFIYEPIDLDEKYIAEVILKIDNLNNRYIINSFYYQKNKGSIEGLFTYVWDKDKGKTYASQFTGFNDPLRDEAKRDGLLHNAFDNFFIRQVVIKKDGGFILTAEDFTSSTQGNSGNRYNYPSNPSLSSGYYYYNPYSGYYRPYSNFGYESSRYYYENILVLSVSKDGKTEWSRIIQKYQFEDNDENFLSFSTIALSGEIHFLFNNDRKNQVITDQSISRDGTIKRNPTLKSPESGYEFMPAISKQVGVNQLIIPCAYRNNICFAKIDF